MSTDAYIGVPYINQVSPNFVKEDFTGDGSTTDFTLTNDVPGQNDENVQVVIGNVVQEPTSAYTIALNGSSQPRILRFTAAPDNGAVIYVIHRGIGSVYMTPAAGSVGANQLAAGLKGYTVDDFTGDGSTTAFTMGETPPNNNSVLVTVDGIVQKITTNYTISGNTITFTSAPDASAEIEVRHLGVRGVVRRAPDLQKDTFTGDGSTTAFTLGFSGATTNNCFVAINGILQEPTTAYSINSSTGVLTFTSAVVNGDTIVVRYSL